MEVKVALVQIDPIYKDPQATMSKAEMLIAKRVQGKQVDLMVFPEMAFTGYQFRDRADILPLCEETQTGPTFRWAQGIAQKYSCGVFLGFPRKESQKDDAKLYNSMMCLDPSGNLIATYDKSFLYVTDKSWASNGSGFQCLELHWLNNLKVCLGICMDINPEEFTAPFEMCELASFCAKEEAKLLLFSSAWCNRNPDDDPSAEIEIPDLESTLNYWAVRLRPLFHKDVYFLAADRVGSEPANVFREDLKGDVTYCGSSCVLSLKNPVQLCATLDTATEDVLTHTLKL